LNVAAELPIAELQRLIAKSKVFIGLPLDNAEAKSLMDRIADTGEESAARLLGSRRKRRHTPSRRRSGSR
jgi:hypothetical protein